MLLCVPTSFPFYLIVCSNIKHVILRVQDGIKVHGHMLFTIQILLGEEKMYLCEIWYP